MSNIYDYEYYLSGGINGARVEGSGKGKIDVSKGYFEASIIFQDLPMHWDPAFNFLMTDTGMVVSVREGSGQSIRALTKTGYSVNWRGAYLYDSKNRAVGHITASSITTILGNKIVMISEVHDSWINTQLGEKVVSIDTPMVATMMPMEHVNILTNAYCVNTDAGNMYWGWTTYPYITNEKTTIVKPQILTVESISIASTRLRNRNVIDYSRTSRIDVI